MRICVLSASRRDVNTFKLRESVNSDEHFAKNITDPFKCLSTNTSIPIYKYKYTLYTHYRDFLLSFYVFEELLQMDKNIKY